MLERWRVIRSAHDWFHSQCYYCWNRTTLSMRQIRSYKMIHEILYTLYYSTIHKQYSTIKIHMYCDYLNTFSTTIQKTLALSLSLCSSYSFVCLLACRADFVVVVIKWWNHREMPLIKWILVSFTKKFISIFLINYYTKWKWCLILCAVQTYNDIEIYAQTHIHRK